MTFPDLLILTLATCYWAFVIPKKSGPYLIFDRIRSKTTLGGLLLCPPCLSVWVAVIMTVLLITPLAFLVWISAVAGGACLAGYYTGTWQQ